MDDNYKLIDFFRNFRESGFKYGVSEDLRNTSGYVFLLGFGTSLPMPLLDNFYLGMGIGISSAVLMAISQSLKDEILVEENSKRADSLVKRIDETLENESLLSKIYYCRD